jgi:hypothetical protein
MRTAHQNVPTPQANPEAANKKFVDDSIAAIPAGGAALVFQPGGTAVDNVYTSFALLYADLITTKGQRVLEVDDTFGAIVMPAGAYNLDDVELVGKKPGFGATTVTIANGVTITGLLKFRSVWLTTANGATTPFVISAGPQKRIQAYQTVFAIGSGSSPLFLISGTGDVVFDLYESAVVDATVVDPPVQVTGTASVQFFLNAQSRVDQRTIVSAIGTTVQVNIYSSSATYNETQPGNLSANFFLVNGTFGRHFPSQIYTVADSPISANLQELVQVNASGVGAISVELPSIGNSGDARGKEIIIKEVSGSLVGTITVVDSFAVNTIDGAPSFSFTTGGQSITLVSDGVNNWNVVAGGSTISGSVVSHPISGAGRASYYSTTPRVVGSFAFNPSDYTVNATLPTLAFRALAANGVVALTNSVQLYNLTDSAVVQTLNFTSTSIVKQSIALTIGAGAGQIPNSEKIYEVRIFLGADPGADPNKSIELYSAHLVATSSL